MSGLGRQAWAPTDRQVGVDALRLYVLRALAETWGEGGEIVPAAALACPEGPTGGPGVAIVELRGEGEAQWEAGEALRTLVRARRATAVAVAGVVDLEDHGKPVQGVLVTLEAARGHREAWGAMLRGKALTFQPVDASEVETPFTRSFLEGLS